MTVISRIETEQQRVRRLEGVGIHELGPIKPVQQYGISGLSTIAKAELDRYEKLAPQYRPKLEEPAKPHYMLQVLGLLQAAEQSGNRQAELFSAEIRRDREEITRLEEANFAAMTEEAEARKSEETWSVLQIVGQYVVSSAFIVVGLGCLSAGIAGGYFLIASGGLGLAGRVMAETGGWETLISYFTASRDLQHKIASYLDTTTFYLSTALGLSGGIMAYYGGAFAAGAITGRIAQTIGLAANASNVVSRVGISMAQRRIAYINANMEEFKLARTQLEQMVHSRTADLQKMLQAMADANKVVKDSVEAAHVELS